MNLVIVQYNAGNIRSVLYALERIGVEALVTDDHDKIRGADKVIFPGVGEASSAMKYLRERGLDRVLVELEQPVLGICLGLQLMCSYSEENDTTCLGIFPETVRKFAFDTEAFDDSVQTSGRRNSDDTTMAETVLKVPQIGWNTITNLSSPLFRGIGDNSYCYFVHGYYAAIGEDTIATTEYGLPYSSGLHKKNFYGVQFHPEKSAATGERLIKNFLEL